MASAANNIFFSVSSWKIINYTMKGGKKKTNTGSQQLSHGKGTKGLRCRTVSWVKKRGVQTLFLAARQLWSFCQLQICAPGFCSDAGAQHLVELCWFGQDANRSRTRSQKKKSGFDLWRKNLTAIGKIPVSVGIPNLTEQQRVTP